MKDCLELIFERNEAATSVVAKYTLMSQFNSEPVYIGENTFEMYTATGAIDWGNVIKTLNNILAVYSDSDKIKRIFLSDIAFEIKIDNTSAVELFNSYVDYQKIMGSDKISAQVKHFLSNCNKLHFIPTINGIDFKSILPTM